MTTRTFSFVQEIADFYEVKTLDDGSARISISIPREFRDLAVAKLSDLLVSEDEIREWLPPNVTWSARPEKTS